MSNETGEATAVAERDTGRREIDIQAVEADSRAGAGAPYPGLRAFRHDESRLFFGRNSCIDLMVDRLAATRFLAVLGSSGSGKSSLVRTGLYDALKLGLHPKVGGRWQIAEFNPGRKPMLNLARALLVSGGNDPANAELLAAHLRRGPRAIAEIANLPLIREGWDLLIVCDQFEELFRFRDYGEREETEAFAALLIETARLELPVHITITMRSEYLAACALIPDLAERISAGMFLTPRMTRPECREAIEGPAGICRFELKEEMVARLLNDLQSFAPFERTGDTDQAEILAHQADQLPLMQHVLNRVWRRAVEERGADHLVLGVPDYDNAGGLNGAIDAHGLEIMDALEKTRGQGIKKSVERVFRALVEGPSLALAVRRPRRVGELIAASGGEDGRDNVLAIIEAFRAADCNFLRTSDQRLDDDVDVDLGHESLIRRWPDLARWFTMELDAGRMWQRLADAAEFHKPDRPTWVSGPTLQRFTEWWQQDEPVRFSAERYGKDFARLSAFVKGSVAEEARIAAGAAAEAARIAAEAAKKRRMYFAKIIAAAVAVVLTVWGAAFYNIQYLAAEKNTLEKQKSDLQSARDNLLERAKQAYSVQFDYVKIICSKAEDRNACMQTYSRQLAQDVPNSLPASSEVGEPGRAGATYEQGGPQSPPQRSSQP